MSCLTDEMEGLKLGAIPKSASASQVAAPPSPSPSKARRARRNRLNRFIFSTSFLHQLCSENNKDIEMSLMKSPSQFLLVQRDLRREPSTVQYQETLSI